MATALITGCSTGIGNLTARALAVAGHKVFASVRDLEPKDAVHADALTAFARARNLDLTVVVLDVLSQASANAAVSSVLRQAGQIDVLVQNAGHLVVGYAEAFTAEDLVHLFDINVFGIQRVNRAVLPSMRERRSGLLVYVGSTSWVSMPPFLAPYVASKAAGDALAAATAYEAGRFGIETSIVMPGAFTSGTEHFPTATHASDRSVTTAYASLDPLVERNEAATSGLFTPGEVADPHAVAVEIARIVGLPVGQRPRRSVVDFTNSAVERVTGMLEASQRDFLTRMGLAELLETDVRSN